MSNQSILEKVQIIVAHALDVAATDVSPGKSFRRDFKADSLDSVEIIMAIEDEFGIEFDQDTAARIDTVGELVAAIEQVQAQKCDVSA
ncbi:acyl carrier protein [Burkholderia ubonensis]|uniref:acyl carrier protein n=1 Tax=Burkholderia ubonensis TaxID=101571 RepID=UPI00075E0E0B|nr:acyl carrier protein [Burkholderia ubonensis]KVD29901.1 acyl carrier protein [Burkholderia ubonensis]KVN65365.1 acyl carrier protein [Burkholderia ubonensis]KVR21899.1 acyl carrier protein [Burkholderia ubonensis]KVT64806.1 acyl carrier protein [Burkholderia ubonensis]KVZ42517.1 acyl carrier protein [Burkholderia ubonensis]